LRTSDAETLFSFYTLSGNVHLALKCKAESYLPHSLTMAQFQLLDRLRIEDGELRPLELAAEFSLTKGAITNLVKQLARKGLILEVLNPDDGRSKLLTISYEGKKAHQNCLIALSEMTTSLLGEFSSDELEVCFPVLKKLKNWLELP